MKIFFVGNLIGFTLNVLFSFVVINYIPKQRTAEVEQIEGVYIFTDSRPVLDYQYLGTVKSSVTWVSTQYHSVRNVLIKKAKREFPNANGLIFHFKDGGTDKCDAIRFK